MTKYEAAKELEGIFDGWIDFHFWAYLQLELRIEYSQKRMREVLENHKKAELKLNKYRAKTEKQQNKMRESGASIDEINAYGMARHKEQYRLLSAWRSLDGK